MPVMSSSHPQDTSSASDNDRSERTVRLPTVIEENALDLRDTQNGFSAEPQNTDDGMEAANNPPEPSPDEDLWEEVRTLIVESSTSPWSTELSGSSGIEPTGSSSSEAEQHIASLLTLHRCIQQKRIESIKRKPDRCRKFAKFLKRHIAEFCRCSALDTENSQVETTSHFDEQHRDNAGVIQMMKELLDELSKPETIRAVHEPLHIEWNKYSMVVVGVWVAMVLAVALWYLYR